MEERRGSRGGGRCYALSTVDVVHEHQPRGASTRNVWSMEPGTEQGSQSQATERTQRKGKAVLTKKRKTLDEKGH